MGVKEEGRQQRPYCGNECILSRWSSVLRWTGEGVLPLSNAVINQVRAPLFIKADHTLRAAGLPNATFRTRGESMLQFHLECISIRQVEFAGDIVKVGSSKGNQLTFQTAAIKHPSKTPRWPLSDAASFLLTLIASPSLRPRCGN